MDVEESSMHSMQTMLTRTALIGIAFGIISPLLGIEMVQSLYMICGGIGIVVIGKTDW